MVATDRFHSDWAGREHETVTVDLWIARPKDDFKATGMMHCLQEYVNKVGLCVSITKTDFMYSGGWEQGWRIGFRNYPRFPSDPMELLAHAERVGKGMAEMGDQGSFMIEEVGGSTYWLTRRLNDGASAQQMAECDCEIRKTCGRTGCRFQQRR